MGDWAKTYKRHEEVSSAFSDVVEFYSHVIRNRSNLELLASDNQKLVRFIFALFDLSQYGEQFDDHALKNTANTLAAAMISAAPDVKEMVLNTPKTPRRAAPFYG